MIKVELPDGSCRSFDGPTRAIDVAESISTSVRKKSVACKVDGEFWDLSYVLDRDCSLEIVVGDSPDGLEVIRHDCAHLLADAVKSLYPKTQVTIGPVIENGFYYDFLREESFSENDIENIEKEMSRIAATKKEIVREVWKRDDAIEFFKSIGEDFKAEIISSISQSEDISLYRQGDFVDLCRGPHAPNVSFARHFKLLRVSGSYWRGDASSTKLQRIYGTAWSTDRELKDYLHQLEEATKRDHRKLGGELELFHISESAVGSIFWHERGWGIFRTLQDYIRGKLEKSGYAEVRTPQMLSAELWQKSGHWDKYRENMFVSESEKQVLAIKPMNCPAHIEIFNCGIKSYKQLPIRMSEFGSCHRNEPSGALHGLMRVRSFTQDDAHIFCREDQIGEETIRFCELLMSVYKDFGFEDVFIKFSDRPEKRAGDDAIWDKSELALKTAIESADYKYVTNKGEGAFYGPKLEFVLRDAIGREWQCGTLQVDFILPERLDANYVNENGDKVRCVILHRAILGSFERFIGILIEEYSGKFPLWLSPVHAVVCTITNRSDAYAMRVNQALLDAGIPSLLDVDPAKINSKIKKYSLRKVPYIISVGEREEQEGTVSVRVLGFGDKGSVTVSLRVEEFSEKVREICGSKRMGYEL